MFRLIGVEFFKLRKRWLPYALLLVLLAIMVSQVIVGYFVYQSSLDQFPYNQTDNARDIEPAITTVTIVRGTETIISVPSPGKPPMDSPWKDRLVLPTAMEGVFNTTQGLGLFLVVVLAASVVGTEYRWGTLRQTLTKGASRPKVLGAKLTAVAIAALIGIIIAVVVGFIVSIITTMLVDGGVNWEFLSTGYIGSLFASLGRTIVAIVLFLLLAALFATLFRSSVAGMAIAFVFIFAESIMVGMLSGSTGWLAELTHYTIGFNVQELAALSSPTTMPEATQPWWQSAGILFTYGLVFLGGIFFIFRRQDLTA